MIKLLPIYRSGAIINEVLLSNFRRSHLMFPYALTSAELTWIAIFLVAVIAVFALIAKVTADLNK